MVFAVIIDICACYSFYCVNYHSLFQLKMNFKGILSIDIFDPQNKGILIF